MSQINTTRDLKTLILKKKMKNPERKNKKRKNLIRSQRKKRENRFLKFPLRAQLLINKGQVIHRITKNLPTILITMTCTIEGVLSSLNFNSNVI